MPSSARKTDSPLAREFMAAFAGFCGLTVTMGFARFAYTPLIPSIIENQWFNQTQTLYIGIAIVIGYLIGALYVTKQAGSRHAVTLLRTSMVIVTLAFLACARPMPFFWFFTWMTLAGIANGVGIILSAQVVLAVCATKRHGRIGGLVVSGIGAGMILSGVVTALVAETSLSGAWYSFAGLSAFLTLISWRLWPSADTAPTPDKTTHTTDNTNTPSSSPSSLPPLAPLAPLAQAHPATLRLVLYSCFVSYGFTSLAIAFPQLLFADFIVRGKDYPLATAGNLWLFNGIGAILGCLLIGMLGDRIGIARCYRLCLLFFGITILALVLPIGVGMLIALSVFMGIFNFGQVPMVAARMRRLFSESETQARRAWGIASLVFAGGQVSGGVFYTHLLEATNDYLVVCYVAGSLSIVGAGIEFVVAKITRRRIPAYADILS